MRVTRTLSVVRRPSRRRRWLVFLATLVLAIVLSYAGLYRLYPFPYRSLIERSAAEFKLDPLLVAAIIRVESNFRPQASSPRGALGLMQLMPATGRWAAQRLALTTPASGLNLQEPETNVRIGCWYLRYLFDRHHDLDAVLAGYNAGEANLPRWRSRAAPQKPLAITYPETREFLRRCRRTYVIYQYLYGT